MSGAGSQFDKKYRVPPDGAELNDVFFDLRFKDIDLRLVALEASLGQFSEATDALINRGLQQISTQLQASIDALANDITVAGQWLATVEQTVAALEQAVESIISGAVPASAVTLTPIPGLPSDNVQVAVAALHGRINGLGDVQVVADYVAAAALVELSRGDIVHIRDNGAGKWVRYQVLTAGDGTWAGVTKTVYWTQDQAPASHGHVIGDVDGLQGALDGLQTAVNGKQDASLTLTDWADINPASKVDVGATDLKWLGAGYTISTAAPSGGADGDFWFRREA